MPCYDSRNEPEYVREDALREFTHNSPVAELLCYTMKNLELQARNSLCRANPKLGKWWKDHQERDRRVSKAQKDREALEQARIRNQIAELQKKLK